MSKPFPSTVGKVDISPGRSIFLMRPTMKNPAANKAPVFPAERTASASPSLTALAAKTILAFSSSE